MPSVEKIQRALDEVLASDAVADLPKTMTPSEDNFGSEAEFLEELQNISWHEEAVNFCISAFSIGWSDALREMFRLMAWEHIDFKKNYTLQYPGLHPENIA